MSSRSFRRYKIGEKIGEHLTVMTVVAEVRGRHPVYLVWDQRSWCPVVCKVYRNSRGAKREHEVLASLAHPNVIRSLGTYEPAILLMEYLQGPTLNGFLDEQPKGRMSVPDAIRTIVHIGGALEHVHKRGWLHLDLKPSNIIVVNGRPILFDFGTARKIGQERPSVVQGTDAYMSPEECRLGEVSPASDVFSLGVTMFELLTGELPFRDGSKGNPYPQLDDSPKSLRAFRPDISAELDGLVLSCMSKDPASRPLLAELIPQLHRFIRRGARMWPQNFQPMRAMVNVAKAA